MSADSIGAAAAFRFSGGSHFGDDLLNGRGVGFPYAGAGHISDGATADRHLVDGGYFFRPFRNEVRIGQKHAVAFENPSLMSKIEVRQFYFFRCQVHPYVQFRPVADREDSAMLAKVFSAVEKVP